MGRAEIRKKEREARQLAEARADALCTKVGKCISRIKVDCGKGRVWFAAECPIHGRCIPTLKLSAEKQAKWDAREPESTLYQICNICPDFEPNYEGIA